ncbi:MAG: hypothetical protein Q4P15_08760 [Propionibacteriaceae bacterium]|nr:hypothetical protein [Propionibacteriaceae bacterium]
MERQLVFVPVARTELDSIQGETQLRDRPAHRVTPELLDELGFEPGQEEDAEYATLVLASVAALATHGERLVLVAEVDSSFIAPGDDLVNGACVVSRVPQTAMTCWFSDADEVDSGDAAAAAKGLEIDIAWEMDEVQALLHGHDLLWNDVEEYRRRD